MIKQMPTKTDAENKILELMIEYGITPQSLVDSYIDKKYPNINPKLANVKQTTKALKMSRATLYRKMREGMPYYEKDDGTRGRYFDIKACKDYLRTKERLEKQIEKNKKEISFKKKLKPVKLVKSNKKGE